MADGSIVIDTQIDQTGADEGLKTLQGKLEKSGERLKTAGKNMSTFITAPLILAAGVAIKTAADQEDAFAKMRAQMGLTADESRKYEEIATDMWKNAFGENMTDVTNAIATVKTNIQDLNDADLQKVTEGAFILQDVFEQDINDTTAVASVMMKNFGIDATDAMDLMTVGMQKGGDYSGELLDTMREYSPMFSAMGIGADEMMNILISGAEAGAWNLDKVGDAVKEFNIRAKDGSKTTAEGFEAIGMNAEEMGAAIAEGGEKGEQAFMATLAALSAIEDPVARNTAGVALFGTQWEDLESDVMSAMGSGVNHVEGFQGATEKAGEAMYDTFGARMTTMMRTLMDGLEPVGQILLDFAERWMPKVLEVVQRLAEWFGKLSPAMQMGAVIFGAVAAAIGPVLIVLGSIIGAVAKFIPIVVKVWGWLSKLAPIFKIIRAVMIALTGPIGLIAVAIGAMVFLVVKYWDEIKAATITVFTAVKEWLVATWDSIKTWMIETISALVTGAIAKWQSMKEKTVEVFTAIKDFFVGVWGGIKDFFSLIISGIVAFVKQRFENLKNNVSNVFAAVRDFIKNTWNGIKSTVTGVVTAIKNAVRDKFEDLKGAVKDKMNAVKDNIKKIWDSVMEFFRNINLFQMGKDIVQGLINGIKGMAGSLLSSVKRLVTDNIPGPIKKIMGIASPSKLMKKYGKWTGEGLEIGINHSAKGVEQSSKNLASAAIGETGNLASRAFKGVLPGATSAASAVSNALNTTNNSQNIVLNYNGSGTRSDAMAMMDMIDYELGKRATSDAFLKGIR